MSPNTISYTGGEYHAAVDPKTPASTPQTGLSPVDDDDRNEPITKVVLGQPTTIMKEAPPLTNFGIQGIAASEQANKTYEDCKTEQTVWAIEQDRQASRLPASYDG